MRKVNNKGFMLMETLLVSVFIVSTLVFLYIQFGKVRDSYNDSFHYNTVASAYSTNTFLQYLQENGIENLSKTLSTTDTVYIDLTTCSATYLTQTSMCTKLISKLGIKKIYYVSSDITNFKNNLPSGMSNSFKKYVRTLKSKDGLGYRLIAEYKDGTFASILARSTIVNTEVKLTAQKIMSLQDGFRIPINYTIKKDYMNNKASFSYEVGDVLTAGATVGPSIKFQVNTSNTSDSLIFHLTNTNGQYTITGKNGGISVTKEISINDTTFPIFKISSTINDGNLYETFFDISWDDSSLH